MLTISAKNSILDGGRGPRSPPLNCLKRIKHVNDVF